MKQIRKGQWGNVGGGWQEAAIQLLVKVLLQSMLTSLTLGFYFYLFCLGLHSTKGSYDILSHPTYKSVGDICNGLSYWSQADWGDNWWEVRTVSLPPCNIAVGLRLITFCHGFTIFASKGVFVGIFQSCSVNRALVPVWRLGLSIVCFKGHSTFGSGLD